jgi:sugar phosphate isomerase/epimerase
VKRGICTYSFQEEFFLNKLSLEDCVRISAELGAPGLEVVAEQMLYGFPRLGEDFYQKWAGWMEKYGAISLAHDMNFDTKRYKGRELTVNEMTDWFILNAEHAKKMKNPFMRANQVTPPEIWPRVIEIIEKLDLKVGVELHPPFYFEHPRIVQHLEAFDRIGSERLGLVVDTGIFEKRFSRVRLEYYIRRGASRNIAEYVSNAYNGGETGMDYVSRVEQMGGNSMDKILARDTGRMIYVDPEKLVEYRKYLLWVHAKFYEMTEEGVEYGIPFDEIIKALKKAGFDGYICSEYEGNRFIQDQFEVDSVEQLRRQQNMLKRLIEAEVGGNVR